MASVEDLRDEITADLVAGGVKTLPYTSEDLTPPCAAVVPGQPYLRKASGNEGLIFGHVRATFHVLLLGPIVEAKKTADLIDGLIWDAYGALRGWRRTQVSQPAEIKLSGSTFMGAVITIEHDTEEP